MKLDTAFSKIYCTVGRQIALKKGGGELYFMANGIWDIFTMMENTGTLHSTSSLWKFNILLIIKSLSDVSKFQMYGNQYKNSKFN